MQFAVCMTTFLRPIHRLRPNSLKTIFNEKGFVRPKTYIPFHAQHKQIMFAFLWTAQVWPHTSSELERRCCSNAVTAGFVIHDELGKWLKLLMFAIASCRHTSLRKMFTCVLFILGSFDFQEFLCPVPFLIPNMFDWCQRFQDMRHKANGPQYTHTATGM